MCGGTHLRAGRSQRETDGALQSEMLVSIDKAGKLCSCCSYRGVEGSWGGMSLLFLSGVKEEEIITCLK